MRSWCCFAWSALLLLTTSVSSAQEHGFGLAGNTRVLQDFDPPTGTVSRSFNLTGATSLRGLATGGDGQLYSLDEVVANGNSLLRLGRISPFTGSYTDVGSTGIVGEQRRYLDYNPNNQSLYAIFGAKSVYSIDPQTGTPTFLGDIGSTPGAFRVLSLAIRNDGAAFITGNTGGNIAVNFYSLSLSTLNMTQVGTILASQGLSTAIETGFLGNTLYALDWNDGQVWTINTADASVALQYTLPGYSSDVATGLAFAAVPEPTTYALIVVVLSTAGYTWWRRRRQFCSLTEASLDSTSN